MMLKQCAVFLSLLATVAWSAIDCAKEFENHYNCIGIKFDKYVNSILKQVDVETISKEASACFTSNGCKAPPDVTKQTTDIDDVSDVSLMEPTVTYSRDIFGIGFEAIQIRKVLNPTLFPDVYSKNITLIEEECVIEQDKSAVTIIEKCIQKKWPGFKFPSEGGLTMTTDYMDSVSDLLDSTDSSFLDMADTYLKALRNRQFCSKDKEKAVEKCLLELFRKKQMTSFDRTLAMERIFQQFCKISKSCHDQIREPCRVWVTDASKVSCDCAQTDTDMIINAIVESYNRCLNVKPNREILTKTYLNLTKRSCEALKEDSKQCAQVPKSE